jgi:elongation factor P
LIDAGELKKGTTIELDGTLYSIVEWRHNKVGRGSAQVVLKLKDVLAGHTVEKSFGANEKFQRVRLERRPAQYLYNDGDFYYFMDTESFEQSTLNPSQVEDAIPFMKENTVVELLKRGDTPLLIEMPITVELAVAETEPGFKGDTASGGGKPATLETGHVVQVPFFVNPGDVLKIDTRSGTYIERV